MKLANFIPFPKLVISILIINLLTSIFYLFVRKYLPPQVPLLYGLPYGEEQLVAKDLLLLPISISILMLVINSVIARFIGDSFSQKVLIYLMFVTTLLGIVTVVKIAFLVGGF